MRIANSPHRVNIKAKVANFHQTSVQAGGMNKSINPANSGTASSPICCNDKEAKILSSTLKTSTGIGCSWRLINSPASVRTDVLAD